MVCERWLITWLGGKGLWQGSDGVAWIGVVVIAYGVLWFSLVEWCVCVWFGMVDYGVDSLDIRVFGGISNGLKWFGVVLANVLLLKWYGVIWFAIVALGPEYVYGLV